MTPVMCAEPGLAPGCPVVPRRGCLVVFDDASRLTWRRSDQQHWQLCGVWPTDGERAEVMDHVRRGGRAIVVFRPEAELLSAFPEEIPEHLGGVALDEGDGLVEVQVVQGDWLPEAMRERAWSFVRAERSRWASRSPLLCPPVTACAEDGIGLRYVLLAPGTTRRDLERDLDGLIDSLFECSLLRGRSA